MNKLKILLILVLVLLAGDIFLGVKYFTVVRQLQHTEAALKAEQTNEAVLAFTKLFITTVLKAETEVDFDTRLKLETAVRNLDDEEILTQWTRFIESKTEIDAQTEVKNLLELLINKIQE